MCEICMKRLRTKEALFIEAQAAMQRLQRLAFRCAEHEGKEAGCPC